MRWTIIVGYSLVWRATVSLNYQLIKETFPIENIVENYSNLKVFLAQVFQNE